MNALQSICGRNRIDVAQSHLHAEIKLTLSSPLITGSIEKTDIKTEATAALKICPHPRRISFSGSNVSHSIPYVVYRRLL
jgi:hypothetical protein